MSILIDASTISLPALMAGDRAEFAKLVDASSGRIYRLLLKLLGDSDDAEDALQETYLKVFRLIKSFEGRSSLSTWLYRIAMNEALMLIRKRHPDISIIEEEKDDDSNSEQLQLVDWCCLPENELLSSETKQFLDKAVDQLSPNYRAVFLLRDVEGLPIKETANVLNLTEENVKVRLLRARMRLREILSSYFSERVIRS